ncbi:MAG TPA: precorrin methylase, partial [Novosphingobium sp.]|nr:precorrin methylase [Novosphingobium sp.]
ARMIARFGTGSLAEALALVAAGPGARLIAPRHISTDGMATAAIAQRSLP